VRDAAFLTREVSVSVYIFVEYHVLAAAHPIYQVASLDDGAWNVIWFAD
jgi:hypothetical protein